MGHKILMIEDDLECIKLVETILANKGYNTFSATTGREGLKMAYELHPDLIILDVMLPDMDGFEVCTRLRELSDVPILMLTARGAQSDLLRGFSAGVDDYVRKPFSREELVARLGALLRRRQMSNGNHNIITHYTDGVLDVNLIEQSVSLHGQNISLTPTEFRILAVLVSHPKQVISSRTLALEVWGNGYDPDPRSICVYIYNLRKKLGDVQMKHQYIRTQWGMGYWFNPIHELNETDGALPLLPQRERL